jgi:hypothetical protein
MDLFGNGNTIVSGSNSVSLSNHTQFGSVPVCSGSIARTYQIVNNGNGVLNLTGAQPVTISGAAAGNYTVIQPAVTSLQPGVSTTFQIMFDPSSPGMKNATVKITNSDCNESPYTFAIQGRGTACSQNLPQLEDLNSENELTVEDRPSTGSLGVAIDPEAEQSETAEAIELSSELANDLTARIYPNPNNGIFHLEISEIPAGKVEMRIFNNFGQEVYTGEINEINTYSDLSHIEPGVYYVLIQTEGERMTLRMVKN